MKGKHMGLVDGKIAIVTASTRGIGRACAVKLAQEGAKVYVAARNRERSMELVEEIVAAGRPTTFASMQTTRRRMRAA